MAMTISWSVVNITNQFLILNSILLNFNKNILSFPLFPFNIKSHSPADPVIVKFQQVTFASGTNFLFGNTFSATGTNMPGFTFIHISDYIHPNLYCIYVWRTRIVAVLRLFLNSRKKVTLSGKRTILKMFTLLVIFFYKFACFITYIFL